MIPITRRDMLHRVGAGMGVLGLAGMMADAGLLAVETKSANPLAPKGPHYPARAKRVIHLFMNGGPSQVDTFDPKPHLTKRNGEMPPNGILKTERKTGALLQSPFKFAKHGHSELE